MTNSTDEPPVKAGVGMVGKGIGVAVVVVGMFFLYTSVLPNLPVVGPLFGAASKHPAEVVVDAALGGSSSEVAPLTPTRDTATEARYIAATEAFLGGSLESWGWTEDDYLVQSYGWCMSLQTYGDSAYDLLYDEISKRYPANEVDAQYLFVRQANQLAEDYLCPGA